MYACMLSRWTSGNTSYYLFCFIAHIAASIKFWEHALHHK